MRIRIVLLVLSFFLYSPIYAQDAKLKEYASRIILKTTKGEKVEGILFAANDSSISVLKGVNKLKDLHAKEKDLLIIPAFEVHKIKLISRQKLEVFLFSGIAIGATVGTVYGEESEYGVFSSVPFGFLGGLAGLFIALVPNDIKPKGSSNLTPKQLKKLQKHQLLIPDKEKESKRPEPIISLSGN